MRRGRGAEDLEQEMKGEAGSNGTRRMDVKRGGIPLSCRRKSVTEVAGMRYELSGDTEGRDGERRTSELERAAQIEQARIEGQRGGLLSSV